MEVDRPCPSATDGEIAAINLESARRRGWARFAQDPRRAGVAEEVVDRERLAAQFLGDLDALDRLEALALQLARVDDSSRAALVQAEVASTMHRFDDARGHLARATLMGGPGEEIERHLLTIDQACGLKLDAVLAARRRIAMACGRLEHLVPLGAVLADLDRFAEADAVYQRAFTRMGTFRRSRSHGSAFNLAPYTENSCPYRTRNLPHSGIDARLRICQDM